MLVAKPVSATGKMLDSETGKDVADVGQLFELFLFASLLLIPTGTEDGKLTSEELLRGIDAEAKIFVAS